MAYLATKHAITGLTRAIALEGRAHSIACGQIDVGNAATELSDQIARGVPQADGSIRGEPRMDVANVASLSRIASDPRWATAGTSVKRALSRDVPAALDGLTAAP